MKAILFICFFVICVTAQRPQKLSPGTSTRASTARQSWSYFYVELSESTINYVNISSVVSAGDAFFYFQYDTLPTFENYFWNSEYQNNVNKLLPNPNVDPYTGVVNDTRLYIGVYGYTDTKYSLIATTQGPYTLRDGKVRNDTGIPDAYTFYKLVIDRRVRQFQVVSQGNPYDLGSNMIYLTNSTSYYPVYYNYMWRADPSTYFYDCLTLKYPAPGAYRLALEVNQPYLSTQFKQDGPNTCSIRL